MPFAKPSLKGRALRLLSGREYARAELERKLTSFEEEPGTLAKVLDELQAKGFISEQRVIESVLNRRAARFGASRIKYELLNKGVAADSVAEAVSRLKATELERAREVWRKKFGERAQDAQASAKQMRFLAARGFGGDVINRVVTQTNDD